MNTTANAATKCGKCGGSGKVAWKHVEGGKCFACNGTGIGRPARAVNVRPEPRDWERECIGFIRACVSQVRAGHFVDGAAWLRGHLISEDGAGWTMAGVELMLAGATPETAACFRRVTGMGR